MGKRILALDIATTTGFCFCRGSAISSGFVSFKTKTKEAPEMRLLKFKQWLESNAADIDTIVYESCHITPNRGKTAMVLAELHSVMKVFAMEHKKTLINYTPGSIKLHIAGKGNAKKEEVIKAVNARYNLSIENDNEADSIAIMSLALQNLTAGQHSAA